MLRLMVSTGSTGDISEKAPRTSLPTEVSEEAKGVCGNDRNADHKEVRERRRCVTTNRSAESKLG